jgi:NAD-dependent deacetylase
MPGIWLNDCHADQKAMDELIRKAAGDLASAKYVIALTGAGISVESGIPPFRGKGGIWEKIDPMEYAHIDAFMANPAKVWDVLIRGMKDVVDQAQPNDAHKALARLEGLGIIKTIITQNVDGLHQAAGSTDVIEFHGNFAWQACLDCGRRCPTRAVAMDRLPPRCGCGGVLRPECVFFGEQIPPRHLNRSQILAMQCDVMLVIGTSAMVHPAATIPVISKQSGTRVIEINTEPTPLTHGVSDYLIAGKAGEVMRRILAEVERRIRQG